MAWYDHEELKAPEDRSERYRKAFPEEYTSSVEVVFSAYKIREKISKEWVRTYNRETFETRSAAKNGRNTIARANRKEKDFYEIVEFKFNANTGQVVD